MTQITNQRIHKYIVIKIPKRPPRHILHQLIMHIIINMLIISILIRIIKRPDLQHASRLHPRLQKVIRIILALNPSPARHNIGLHLTSQKRSIGIIIALLFTQEKVAPLLQSILLPIFMRL